MGAMTTTTVNPERRCRGCGHVYRVLDDAGEPLPREQRQWDLVRAARYKGGYRWRDMCRPCSNTARVELARARARRRESTAEARVGRATLTERQAAQLAGVSLSTVTRARRKGALPRELTPAAVEAWAKQRRGEG